MKTFALATAAVLALLSIAGCGTYVGKGKAPPPVVNQGVTLYMKRFTLALAISICAGSVALAAELRLPPPRAARASC
jgi:hypothetical protein